MVTDFKKTKKGEVKPVKIEADNIFKIINYLIKNEKVNKLSDIGILFRSIKDSSSRCIGYLLEDLNSAGINYQISTADLIEQPEIKSVLTLFYHLVSDDDPHKHFFNR